MSEALQGIKLIDLTRVRSGPSAVRQFADWGADVIKVETPQAIDGSEDLGGHRLGSDFQNLHRNKRSITLNLKTKDGLNIFKKLIKNADILVENYRPNVKKRLGIDYENLKSINPRLIYASISGFGQNGPYSDLPGFDQIAQGMGGLMSVTGHEGKGPLRVGIPVADLSAGLHCALGILTALFERQKSGCGQIVSASLLESQIAMLDFQATRYLISNEIAGQTGNDHPTMTPMGTYQTANGYINIASIGEAMWRRLCNTLDIREYLDDKDFEDDSARTKNRSKLTSVINKALSKYNNEEWIKKLNKASIPCGPINNIEEVFNDPQVKYSNIVESVNHPKLGKIKLVGQAVKLSRTPSKLKKAAPEKGEHNKEILTELGYNDKEIKNLKIGNII
ncbi:MAG: Acetyl-CoA:oxalate CoA-transferase [Alphaproteobacteria bacterium MarineAlpha9_Bin3]|nr:MAG: Acetyl-CoA:oxalate CoA-transferase [Alphaproteobacteria bacterium MarineAlpha9_Bin3]|tara:strand:- start:1568 stop:2746 length:1179 start_codon:yes stop_codon:yes gene_type:complete